MSYPLIQKFESPLSSVSAFGAYRDRPFSFFLDSGLGNERLGRYSFVGADPFLVVKSRGRRVSVGPPGVDRWEDGDPFDVVRRLLDQYRLEPHFSPVPLNGGAIGYLSYDLCHFIERLPSTAEDDLQLPESCLGFYDVVVAFDHLLGKAYAISTGFPELDESKRVKRAMERLSQTSLLMSEAGRQSLPCKFEMSERALRLRSNFAHNDYLKAVQRAREHIIAGDIFQVNISQRFDTDLNVTPYELFSRLRQSNPAPFACYFATDEVAVVGSSPERFLRLEGDVVETRPIKGTRPRGKDEREDRRMSAELLASAKDRAENVMIVDLERNDLGRACCYGSIKVTELAALEKWPAVFHLT
ncbi:MAG: anthranilate synthase component I family protein, partial [Dehalococcoidia bacterium]|nr:anthranilate synthase component I family protein [Dehalococcoidia bacterium]